jgi:phage-related protein
MSLNLDAILKIVAKVDGEQAIRNLSQSVQTLETNAKSAKTAFKDVVSSAAWQGAAVAAAAVGTAIALSTREAISFESAMAEVRKVVNGLDTPAGMKAIRQEIFELSREIPITAKGFAEMYAAAGQAGIPRAELRAFATDVAKVAVAFDLTAGEAGEAMAKLRTNLGLTQPELMELADAANYLSNNMASTASEIVNFMLRSGSAGKQAGLSTVQTAAFGSAMIASGAAAEVASTSFNNMIKALSRGDSMTDRQVGALIKLGYAGKDVAKRIAEAEKEMVDAVERESALRIKQYEYESRAIISEINRRYRDMATAQQDAWDDEERAWSRNQEDRFDSVSKRIQRERQAEIDASNERAKQSGADNKLEIQAIEDKYDERLKAVRRSQEDERIEYQRGQRDFQQGVKDQMDDQRQMEIDAVQEKYEELKKIEEARKKVAIENAKATAKAMVGELGPNMAKMLQKDAVGTIRDVFARIKALPAEMQMSVISDLFGDEARALLPLINNSKLLDDALGLVGDKSKYAGSTAREFATRIATTEAKLQLAKNRLNEVAIVFGDSFAPALIAAMKAVAPILEGFAWLITNVPFLGPIIAVVASAFVGLVAVAPFVMSFINLMALLKGALGAKAVVNAGSAIAKAGPAFASGIKGILQAFNPFFAANIGQRMAAVWGTIKFAIADFLKSNFVRQIVFTLGQVAGTLVRFFTAQLVPIIMSGLKLLAGIFSGPVGWALLAAGLVALIYQFREQIGAFFTWVGQAIGSWISSLWEWGEPIREFWMQLWEGVKALTGGFFTWLGEVLNTYLVQPFMTAVETIKGWLSQLWTGFVEVTTAALTWFGQALYDWFVQPWVNLVQFIAPAAAALWETVKEIVGGFFSWFGQALYDWFVQPWITVGTFLYEAAVQLWETIKAPVQGFFAWFGQTLYDWLVRPWITIGTLLVDAAVQTWNWITEAVAKFFSWVSTSVMTYFVEPITSALTAIREWFVGVWNTVKDFLVGWFTWWGDFLYKALVEPWVKAGEWIPKAAAIVWTAVKDLVSGFFTWFGNSIRTYLVEPVQQALTAVGQFFGTIFSSIAQVVSGFFTFWVNTISTYLITPIRDGLSGLGQLFSQAFVAVRDYLVGFFNWWAEFFYNAFVVPVQNALTGLGQLFATAWQAVADALGRAFGVIRDAWQVVTTAMGTAWSSFIGAIQSAWSGIANAFVSAVIRPIQDAWRQFTGTLADLFTSGMTLVINAMSGLARGFNEYVVTPIGTAWNQLIQGLSTVMSTVASTFGTIWSGIQTALVSTFTAIGKAFNDYVASPIQTAWETVSNAMANALKGAVDVVVKAYQSISGAVTGAFKGAVGIVNRVINSIINALNQLIGAVNKVRSAVGLSTFNLIPNVSIAEFAKGGLVTRPTLAMVGEGGEPEYIIPASKMAGAAQNYLDGMRGASIIDSRPRVATGPGPGALPLSPQVSITPSFAVGNGDTSVSITTGPVQQVGSERYVTVEDLQKAVATASRQTRDALLRDLAQPGTRQRLGMS